MKIQFDSEQGYQKYAAITDLFEGQPKGVPFNVAVTADEV